MENSRYASSSVLFQQLFPDPQQGGIHGILIDTPLDAVIAKEGSNWSGKDQFIRYNWFMEHGHYVSATYVFPPGDPEKHIRQINFFYYHFLEEQPDLKLFKQFCKEVEDYFVSRYGQPALDQDSESKKNPDLFWVTANMEPPCRFARLIFDDKRPNGKYKVLKLVCDKI